MHNIAFTFAYYIISTDDPIVNRCLTPFFHFFAWNCNLYSYFCLKQAAILWRYIDYDGLKDMDI